ncbi:hypothetical protein Gohar_001869 [Gossypium harknessii]|uniref:BTB domain-containing protein n=1 Tax=Gossypium harknessii TaxID=34285 RepID=A0A7J9I5C4_9ROSI|nr:hypothetical protein [Gossypium harknessii]
MVLTLLVLLLHQVIVELSSSKACSGSGAETLIPFGFPRTDHLEPSIEPHLKPIQLIETLADLFRRSEACLESEKSLIYIEQYSILSSLGDPKLLRRCLRAARQHALDVHSKVVLSAWLRYERREDELEGVSPMDWSSRFILECPKATLVSGYDPNSIYDNCKCYQECAKSTDSHISKVKTLEEDSNVSFCVGNEEIDCIRFKIAALSRPLKAMLYGSFKESKSRKIDFSYTGTSVEGMRAVDLYSRTRRVDLFPPEVVLELLSFANRLCCEEMKSDCDIHLASLVSCIEDALILIEYGLEERANFLVASCLQVLLRQLPSSLYNPKVMKMFCSFEAKERLASAGHASFILYYFLSQVSMEVNTVSNVTVMLLERLRECAAQKWQKALALHQLGCVLLERQEYASAQCCFEAAAEASHVYSLAGNARCRFKQGQRYSAYKLMSSVISEYKAVGWMYQERSLYNVGKDKIDDLNTATELDPTLVFPYKYRAVLKAEEKQTTAAILEIDRIIGFKLEPDCLELRAWFLIAIEDYGSALRDVRALFTLDPNYRMFDEYISGENLIEFLNLKVQQGSQADCWMQLYDRWSYTSLGPEPESSYVIQLLEEAIRCPSDGLRKGQALNNLGSIYVDCGKLDEATNCYMNALEIKHTRAYQGLARIHFLRNQRKAAYDEMSKLIEKASFKPDLQMLHLRAAFYESIGDLKSAVCDCEAALCLEPNHIDTLDLYNKARGT